MFEPNNLELRKITGTKKWVVLNKFVWTNGKLIEKVPAGFITDLASTPRITWTVFPKSGIYTEASVIHDFLYREGEYPRKQCDKIFKKALRQCGVGRIRTEMMYRAVRMFGGSFYKG